jgi:hypothetical protein
MTDTQKQPSWRDALTNVRTVTLPEPEEIAAPEEPVKRDIPEDTLRRLAYPVIETVTPDGFHHFKHDPGIRDDARIAG